MATWFDIKIDKVTGDIVIQDGDVVTIADEDVIIQNVSVTLQTFSGGDDWEFDPTLGAPWFRDKQTGRVILGNNQIPDVEAILKAVISGVEGVEEIVQFGLDYDNADRRLTVEFKIRTEFGVSPIEKTVI